MKSFRFQHKKGGLSLFGKMVGGAAILLIGLIAYLASSPEAHEIFHPDAGHGDHGCVVTSFAAGEALYVAPEIKVQPTAVVLERMEGTAGEMVRDFSANLLPPVCGPPARNLIA